MPVTSAFDAKKMSWEDFSIDEESKAILSNFEQAQGLFEHFQRIKKLKKAQTETSTHCITDFINDLHVGVRATMLHEYTWIELKNLLRQRNSALLVRLPAHLAMIFAAGEDTESGKKRHVLIGRPSGGQSPSGWIPWSSKDVVPSEHAWNDEISLSGGIESSSNCGLTMYVNANASSSLRKYFICQRDIIHVYKEPVEVQPFDHSIPIQSQWDKILFETPIECCSACEACNFVYLENSAKCE